MDLVIGALIAFLAGFLVKAVDWMDDERKTSLAFKLPLSLCYGVLIGYLIGNAAFSVLFLAALIAQVFARKIDTTAHRAGFVIAILSLFFFGFPGIDIPFFAFFLILAFLDEADLLGKLHPLTEYRAFLKLGSLAIGLLTMRWEYFIGIMAFDIGYMLFGYASGKSRPSGKPSQPGKISPTKKQKKP
jgi:hypothetical protein